ncbi:MAG: hypothetical protein PHH04_04680 [Thomasclavelia sp.]|nr:hypothetical protein [Thomasclavelia sp.]
MKRTIQIVLVFIFLIGFIGYKFAYRTETIEKDGTKYKVNSNVYFYYPKDFKKTTLKNRIEFSNKNKENYYFFNILDNEDMDSSEKSDLYKELLQSQGCLGVKVLSPLTSNNLVIYEYTGQKDNKSFKEVVYFDTSKTYIYGYQSNNKTYKANIKTVNKYLESFNLNEGKSR